MRTLSEKVDAKYSRSDEYLQQKISREFNFQVSKGQCKKLIESGLFYLNQKKSKSCSKPLFSGSKAFAFIPNSFVNSGLYVFDPSWIKYESSSLIVLNKPSGLPSQATKQPIQENLYAMVHAHLASRESVKLAYCGLHHRLDRDTSGLILLTKKKSANAPISEQFQNRKIHRNYLCLCHCDKQLPRTWAFESQMRRKKNPTQSHLFEVVESDGLSSKTDFKCIQQNQELALIEASPKTGRTHQIRVHLSHQNLPICGDPFYGPSQSSHKRLMLHAQKIIFEDPTKGKQTVSSPAPSNFSINLSM